MRFAPCPPSSAARNAVEAAGVAVAYLEACGESVPTDPAAARGRAPDRCSSPRSGRAAPSSRSTASGSSGSIDALDAEARDADEAEVLIVPMVGLKMRGRASIFPRRAPDSCRRDRSTDRGDAQRGDGPCRLGTPVPCRRRAGRGPDSAAEALNQLRELISVMRLFKAGGIGLGPYAFAPTGEGHWCRIPSGAPRDPPRRLPAE